ncbi:MAG: LysR family transcriptional regulator [Alphaproteobacteria bacterium]|nr:LysR family transcriptional regulator [Alphaproteobacteria bacterium]
MHYTKLRSFHAVAMAGGFTAAARQLKVGQPTITTQVRALERQYRVELFHRRGRRVELTDAGRGLLALTQRMLSLEAEAIDFLNATAGLRSGHLKIAAVGPYHVTEMLAAFGARYPEIDFSVSVGNSRDALKSLLEFRSDVGVLAHVEDDPRFHAVPYSRHPVAVFVDTGHPWARRRSIRIRELGGQRMILRELGSTTRRAFEEALDRAGVRIGRAIEIGSREAVWLAVARGMGIGVVSEFEFTPHPRLHLLRVSDAEIYTYAHVVCLAERRAAPLIAAFLDVVAGLLAHRGKARGRAP